MYKKWYWTRFSSILGSISNVSAKLLFSARKGKAESCIEFTCFEKIPLKLYVKRNFIWKINLWSMHFCNKLTTFWYFIQINIQGYSRASSLHYFKVSNSHVMYEIIGLFMIKASRILNHSKHKKYPVYLKSERGRNLKINYETLRKL